MHTDLLPLSRSTVDRDGVARNDPDLLARLWADPATRVVLVHQGLVAVVAGADSGPERARLALVAPSDVAAMSEAAAAGGGRAAGHELADIAYLGRDHEGAYVSYVLSDSSGDARDFAGPPSDPGKAPVDGADWATLRQVGAALGDRDAGLAASAVALAAWHARHPRCPRCGGRTRAVHAGWARACVEDGSQHHPRTDPAIIVAVTDPADRLLLAHAASWPQRRFSLVAGYVEPGESLEAAVRREVAEECGLAVTDPVYQGSQPWPFPASLMLAYRALSPGGEPVPDGDEITEARFVSRGELAGLATAGDLLLPMRASIARALIEDWYGQVLPGA